MIVGASIGSASAPDDGISPDALLSKADIALYAAKADGRRVWRAFEQEMDAKIQIRRLIELELRAAVATDADRRLLPADRLRRDADRIVGFEALARWRSAAARPGLAGRIHPDRRGDRAHGGDGRGRAEAGLQGLRGLAGRGQRVGQSVVDAVPQRQSRKDDPRGARGRQSRARAPRPRNHGIRRCSRIGATRAARSKPCAPRACAFRSTISAPDIRA